MGVDVHGRVDIRVSQQLLHILGGRAVGEKIAGECVPLRYNNDEAEREYVLALQREETEKAEKARLINIRSIYSSGLGKAYSIRDQAWYATNVRCRNRD